MSKAFSVPVINVVSKHNNKTKKILSQFTDDRMALSFVREAILSLAEKNGFQGTNFSQQAPSFVPADIWHKMLIARQRTEKIDYSYVPAFFYLKQLPHFQYYSKAKLTREAVITHFSD